MIKFTEILKERLLPAENVLLTIVKYIKNGYSKDNAIKQALSIHNKLLVNDAIKLLNQKLTNQAPEEIYKELLKKS